MRVYTSKYRNHWISPYTILEKIFFWREIDYDEPIIEKWSDRLNPFCQALQKFLDFVHPEINYVKIDKWDTWSMDRTLGPIILPMLKQLKETQHGSPIVDLEDVPERLRTISHYEYESQQSFDFYHEHKEDDIHSRWDWVLSEMIFAFEHLVDDSWQEQYRSGNIDWKHVPCEWDENGKPTLYETEDGPNHTYECDYDAIRKIEERMENGFRLFGKYYRGLWD